MSIPTTVPETHGQTGDDARDELRRVGAVRLTVRGARRFHAADGTSYARALGLSSVLSILPGLVAVAGLAAALGLEERGVLGRSLQDLAPGPAGRLLTSGIRDGGASPAAIAWGLAGMLVSGTLAMVHLERGANRIYGVDEHRPALRRFATSAALASTAGVALLVALGVIVAGEANGDQGGSPLWTIVRWPVAIALVAAPMTAFFRFAPNRRQPHPSWLLSGTVVAVALWIVVTLLLGLAYENAAALGTSFGPILGVLALLVWAYLTAVAVLFGLAFSAELEAERAGQPSPDRDGDAAADGGDGAAVTASGVGTSGVRR
jgi:YihY family inner membrane protein